MMLSKPRVSPSLSLVTECILTGVINLDSSHAQNSLKFAREHEGARRGVGLKAM